MNSAAFNSASDRSSAPRYTDPESAGSNVTVGDVYKGAPRLAYIGNVNVEQTTAGPMQLYRLLQNYPKDKLQIFEVETAAPAAALRVESVPYKKISRSFERGWFFARTRLPRLFWKMLQLECRRQAREIARRLADFKPEAILTIHEGFAWMTAAEVARFLNIPYHIILHDEWFRDIPMAASLKPRFESEFKKVYCNASSRLCVSPFMAEAYEQRFGASGLVLYPIRDAHVTRHLLPPPAVSERQPKLKVVYAGNVWHRGNWKSLQILAEVLAELDGELMIFGPTTKEEALRNGLISPNVSVHGLVLNLVQILRDHAHVLFVPMTFDASETHNMQISFPSKLVDYTAAGVPILIYGPEYSSAVRWARDHHQFAEIIATEGREGLRASLVKLTDPHYRQTLGANALRLGEQYFSFESGNQLFVEALAGRRSTSQAFPT